MKLVSIIIPIYNAEKYIRRCIFSLLYQTHSNLEIILVNDGSTDNCGKICDFYAKRYPQIHVYHQENQGPASARNTGLAVATGTYIQFVDADDTIKPKMTGHLVSVMEAGADLAICGFETENQIFTTERTGSFSREEFLPFVGELYHAILLPSLCNKMYRREIILEHDITLLHTCSFGEDLLFNLDYLESTQQIHILAEPFYDYRRNLGSLTNDYMYDMFFSYKTLHERIRGFLKTVDSYHGDNKEYINRIFANGIIHAFTNLFHPESQLTKYKRFALVKRMTEDSTVIRQLPYFTDNLQARILRKLIIAGKIRDIHALLRTKEMLRNRFNPIFQALQRMNGTGF